MTVEEETSDNSEPSRLAPQPKADLGTADESRLLLLVTDEAE